MRRDLHRPSGARPVLSPRAIQSSIPTVCGRAEARPVTISTVCDHAEARPVTRNGHTDAEPTHITTCTLTKPAGLALYFKRSVALPSAARPVTVNRLTDNKLAGRLRRPLTWPAGPALQTAPRGAMPPEARPVTGKWLTERGLAAYTARDRDRDRNRNNARREGAGDAGPSEAGPVVGNRVTFGQGPATAPRPTRHLKTRPVTERRLTHTNAPGTRASVVTERPCGRQKLALPSEARPITGTRHMTHRVTNRDTGRALQGTARDPGATEAHP